MIKKYATYAVEDFVADERFVEWVKSPDTTNTLLWKEIIAADPGKEVIMMQARKIILQLSEASGMHVEKNDSAEIWQNLETELFSVTINSKRKPLRSYWLAAASVVILLSVGWLGYKQLATKDITRYTKMVTAVENPMKEIVNKGEKTLVVRLPDGSKVFLAKNSKLSYIKDFTQKNRQVYLSGAAFFNVTKDPEKPFIVYANELVTKVLGTSFTVKAFDEDSKVTVAVKTGKVSVFANKHVEDVDPETKGIILIPNQQADFQRKNETISRSLVEQPKIVIAKNDLNKFSFNNAPVTEIFAAMESAYGVDFLFDEEVLSYCRLTTSLSEETLFEKLDVICAGIDATYKVVDAQIVITGKKCD